MSDRDIYFDGKIVGRINEDGVGEITDPEFMEMINNNTVPGYSIEEVEGNNEREH